MKKILIILLLFSSVLARGQDPVYPAASATPSNIIAAEYFIDTDPGFGNGTAIATGSGIDLAGIAASLNTTGLSNGIHRFAIRTKSNDGTWSHTVIQEFLVDHDPSYPPAPAAPSNMVTAEYFIDTDPGFGNGTAVATGSGIDLAGIVASLNTTGLSNGIHRFAIRTKSNDGTWSHTVIQEFLVDQDPSYPTTPAAASNMVTAEYFIDTDPGFGNATTISIPAGNVDINNIIASLNTTGLSNSIHTLGIRSKDNNGKWSLTNIQNFLVDEDFSYPPAPAAPGNIMYAEYFFDTDPGFGNGTAIAITPGVDLNNVNFTANTATLSDGTHTLFIRSLDDWSITNYVTFLKGTPLPLDFISFTAVANGNDVQLNWQTENEINTSHFDIEFSRNGRDFTKIAEEASANTPGTWRYQYLHLSPGEGRLYYRLKQVDRNGASKYSNTAIVNMDRTRKTLLYPNPASNFITLKNVSISDISSLRIIDAHGRQVMQTNVVAGLQYDISNLSNGSYILKIRKKDGTEETLSFVKIRQ